MFESGVSESVAPTSSHPDWGSPSEPLKSCSAIQAIVILVLERLDPFQADYDKDPRI